MNEALAHNLTPDEALLYLEFEINSSQAARLLITALREKIEQLTQENEDLYVHAKDLVNAGDDLGLVIRSHPSQAGSLPLEEEAALDAWVEVRQAQEEL